MVGHTSDKPGWEWRGPEDQNSSSKRSWKLSMEKGRPLGHIKKYRHTHKHTHFLSFLINSTFACLYLCVCFIHNSSICLSPICVRMWEIFLQGFISGMWVTYGEWQACPMVQTGEAAVQTPSFMMLTWAVCVHVCVHWLEINSLSLLCLYDDRVGLLGQEILIKAKEALEHN